MINQINMKSGLEFLYTQLIRIVVIGFFTLATVGKVYSAEVNIAIKGTASQSSDYSSSYTANQAIDGDTTIGFTHTSMESDPWWEVDLGEEAEDIKNIILYNRADCCQDKLRNYRVIVKDGNGVETYTSEIFLNQPAGGVKIVSLPGGISGQYVGVEIQGEGVLSLAEVQVMKEIFQENVALNGSATQSSTGSEGGSRVLLSDDDFDELETDYLQQNEVGGDATLSLSTTTKWGLIPSSGIDGSDDRFLFMDGASDANKLFWKKDVELVEGNEYNFEFYVAVNRYVELALRVDGHDVSSSIIPTEYADWTKYTMSFTATSGGIQTIGLRSISTRDGYNDFIVDKIKLTEIGSGTSSSTGSEEGSQVLLSDDDFDELVTDYLQQNEVGGDATLSLSTTTKWGLIPSSGIDGSDDRFLFMDGASDANKLFWKKDVELVEGNEYNFEFYVAVNRYVELALRVDSNDVSSSIIPTEYADWTKYTISFTATSSGIQTIGLRSISTRDGYNDFIVDKIKLTEIGSGTSSSTGSEEGSQVLLSDDDFDELVTDYLQQNEVGGDATLSLSTTTKWGLIPSSGIDGSDDRFLFMDGASDANKLFWKKDVELVEGNEYNFEFYVAVNRYVELALRVDSNDVSSSIIPTEYADWTKYTISFTATSSGIQTIGLRSISTRDGYNDFIVDKIKLTEIGSGIPYLGEASRAVDGNTDSTTLTQREDNPWWEVDLGSPISNLKSVILYNRTDCCEERLSNYRVIVKDENGVETYASEIILNHPVDDVNTIALPDGTGGQYVRIEIQGEGILSLAEVQVMKELFLENMATKGIASQSSDFSSSYTADKAIDGHTRIGFTHTPNEIDPWLQIDLGEEVEDIKQIILYNRFDCCQNRLSNYRVIVKDENGVETYASKIFSNQPVAGVNVIALPDGINGQYVRVEIQGEGTLSLAEVQVMKEEVILPSLASKNVASLGVPTQSSIRRGNGPGNIVDTSLSSYGLTEIQWNPWFKISLDEERNDLRTVVVNTPINSSFLNDYRIIAKDASNTEVYTSSIYNGSSTTNLPDNINVKDIIIQGVGSGILRVTEVSVFTKDDEDNVINLAPYSNATQSSTDGENSALIAIDGNTGGSFSHTTQEDNPWLEVDLGEEVADIKSVYLYNRTDCCQDRLKNYRILVKDADGDITYKSNKYLEAAPGGIGVLKLPNDVNGRYVRVQIEDKNSVLSLVEIEVFAKNRPWQELVLEEQIYDIKRIVLYNQTDERESVLKNYRVIVKDFDGNITYTSELYTRNPSASFTTIELPETVYGQTIRVELEDQNEYLYLKDIEVLTPEQIDEFGSFRNIATKGVASQSSDFDSSSNYAANKAIDGDTRRDFTHTSNEINPWLQIDLGEEVEDIKQIVLYNRLDCCQDRLSNYRVIVKDINDIVTYESSLFTKAPIDGIETIKLPDNVRGHYVRIELEGMGVLSLSEVKIMAKVEDEALTFCPNGCDENRGTFDNPYTVEEYFGFSVPSTLRTDTFYAASLVEAGKFVSFFDNINIEIRGWIDGDNLARIYDAERGGVHRVYPVATRGTDNNSSLRVYFNDVYWAYSGNIEDSHGARVYNTFLDNLSSAQASDIQFRASLNTSPRIYTLMQAVRNAEKLKRVSIMSTSANSIQSSVGRNNMSNIVLDEFDKSNALFIASSENPGSDDSSEYVHGYLSYEIANTRKGIDQTIFVGYYQFSGDNNFDASAHNQSFSLMEANRIFVQESSTSHATPKLASLALRIADENPGITAEELKDEIFKLTILYEGRRIIEDKHFR